MLTAKKELKATFGASLEDNAPIVPTKKKKPMRKNRIRPTIVANTTLRKDINKNCWFVGLYSKN